MKRMYLINLILLLVTVLILIGAIGCSNQKYKGFTSNDVIYFVMTDRFYDGDTSNDEYIDVDKNNPTAYHGGDLQGIIQKLDYIESLGVTAIWITPVVDNQTRGYHGYWATDFYKVDEHLGTLEDMKQLVDECHKRGIKVVMDYVVNHTGYNCDWYRTKKDWFNPRKDIINWNDQEQIERGWLADLPDFNFDNEEVRQYFIDNALWWIDQTGIDGIRLDTVKHVPIDYWVEFSAAVKAKYPDFFFIGEVWHSKTSYLAQYQNAGIDSITNYAMFDGIRNAFSGNNVFDLVSAIRNEKDFTNPTMNSIFIDNHDNTRFMSFATWDSELQTKQALTFIMSYPAIPVIYYGTEIGMEGGSDPDNRRDMEWDTIEDNEMLSFYMELTDIRAAITEKKMDGFEIIDNDRYYISYRRFNEEAQIVFVINTVKNPKEESVKISDKKAMLTDYFTGEEFETDEEGVLHITLEPLRTYALCEDWGE